MATDYSKQEVLGIVQREAQERGIPRDDFLRFAYIETGGKFDEQASRGPNGAKGLFQFVPSTAAQYGIAGRELDAVANTDAAARLYLDNKSNLTSHHTRTGQPYLSGQAQPNGLDMYMAHQQGSAGYHSIQAAIADGNFTRSDTRPHLLNNVSSRDIQQVTGMSMDQFRQLPDKQMAETFVKYWDTKYRNISIPEVGVQPLGQGGQGQTPGGGGQTPGGGTRPADPMADGVLERGEKGPAVKTMQEQLIKAGITQVNGKPFTADSDFGQQTEAAVREYQRTRGLKVDGEAGPDTLKALRENAPAKTQPSPEPATPTPTQGNGTNWPAPGNFKINDADKPGEGHGEFGTSRGGGVRTHKGVDIEGKVGDPIESFRPGTVIAVKPNNGAAGNMVTIDHGNGLTSTYMHLDKINAKVGQKVPEDIEVIGTMGRTGNTPKAGDTHLHFEIRQNGVAVDPMPYLKGAKDLDSPAAAKTELKQGD
ncbi:MAG: peptidoglycan DD-metalloendopeptidase family protein, partial [Lysobacter sp.]|nr:peptidoglycan DD-metalloendopeptidase family protein [Lysobacter sp.]